jgi:Glycosyltransferase Family 4
MHSCQAAPEFLIHPDQLQQLLENSGSSMPKILMVTTIPSTLCAFLLPFADHLRKLGWQVDAMAQEITANAECVKTFDRVINVQWSRNPLELSNFFATPQAIQAIISDNDYDIIHVHTPVAAFVTRYALKNLKQRQLKVIYTAHGFHFHPRGKAWKNAIFLQLEKMAGRWTDYLVTINQAASTAPSRSGAVHARHWCGFRLLQSANGHRR